MFDHLLPFFGTCSLNAGRQILQTFGKLENKSKLTEKFQKQSLPN